MKQSICLIAICVLVSGCAARSPDANTPYQTVAHDPRRDTDTARAENAKAVALMEKGDWPAAETTLQQALSADIMFGPAHNNLGKVYYHQKKLYLAAWEFEYAAKLMPHQAEPKNNIGMIFETAGKWNDAVDNYTEALELEPDNPELIGNTARARLRRGDTGPQVRDLLNKLVMIDTRPEWVDWARKRLALIPQGSPSTEQTSQP